MEPTSEKLTSEQLTLEGVLRMLNGNGSKTEIKTPHEAILEEIHRHNMEELDTVYQRAMKNLDGKLQYASAKHLATGFAGVFLDGILLVPYIGQLTSLPAVKSVLQQKFGKDSVRDIFVTETAKRKGTSIEEQKKKYAKLENVYERAEQRVKALAEYSEHTGKSVADILRTPEDQVAIIMKVDGSFENYEQRRLESLQGCAELIEKLENVQKMPLGMMLRAMVRVKIGSYHVEDRALNDMVEIVAPGMENYVKELALVCKEVLREYCKLEVEQFQNYKMFIPQ